MVDPPFQGNLQGRVEETNESNNSLAIPVRENPPPVQGPRHITTDLIAKAVPAPVAPKVPPSPPNLHNKKQLAA